MTTNHTITDAELQAIRSVDCHIRTIAHEDAWRPSQPVQEDIEKVSWLVNRLCTAPPIEEVASRPNGEPAPPALDVMLDETGRFGDPPFGRPIGISRDERDRDETGQPEGSQGASVVDRGGPDIKWRWAKETIGLIALELNEAYAEFSVTEDGWSTPNGKLHCAAKRLEEVMQRLGLTDHLTDELPF